MNGNTNSGCPCFGGRPFPPNQGFRPNYPSSSPGPVIPQPPTACENFPVGMGYVPMQNWETPSPLECGFRKGTIFPSLDYPFTRGRCRS